MSLPIKATRAESFAKYFKNYMGLSSLVVASLPIPITSAKLIPVFESQRALLSTYTPLFCFLLLGFIFYKRHVLAKYIFPDYYFNAKLKSELKAIAYRHTEGLISRDLLYAKRDLQEWVYRKRSAIKPKVQIVNLIPIALIALSITSAFNYNYVLEIEIAKQVGSRVDILAGHVLPAYTSTYLMASYLGIFLFAEAAFVLMATKEYLQDILEIDDKSLMTQDFTLNSGSTDQPASNEIKTPSVPEIAKLPSHGTKVDG